MSAEGSKRMSSPSDEIKSGDERRALVAMRDMLADRMVEAETNVVAQVAARLQAVIARLSELGNDESEESPSDEIARRRADRRAASEMVETPRGDDIKRRRRGS